MGDKPLDPALLVGLDLSHLPEPPSPWHPPRDHLAWAVETERQIMDEVNRAVDYSPARETWQALHKRVWAQVTADSRCRRALALIAHLAQTAPHLLPDELRDRLVQKKPSPRQRAARWAHALRLWTRQT